MLGSQSPWKQRHESLRLMLGSKLFVCATGAWQICGNVLVCLQWGSGALCKVSGRECEGEGGGTWYELGGTWGVPRILRFPPKQNKHEHSCQPKSERATHMTHRIILINTRNRPTRTNLLISEKLHRRRFVNVSSLQMLYSDENAGR